MEVESTLGRKLALDSLHSHDPNSGRGCNQKEGRQEMHREHNHKQPSPLGLTLTERIQCNHTTRTQHNKRLLTVFNRNLMIQL